MGQWSLTIHGAGPHDNGIDEDIERVALKLLFELRAAGHSVAGAAVTIGSRREIVEAAETLRVIKHPEPTSFPAEHLTDG